jgi:hypothetical protein
VPEQQLVATPRPSDERWRVAHVDPSADPRYDAYVRGHDQSTAYHLGAWAEVLRSAYHFRPEYIALTADDGRVEGVMPLMYSRGIVSGKRIRSLPVVPTAGPLASSAAGEVELLRSACRIADECAQELIIVSRGEGYEDRLAGLRRDERPPAWITPLPGDAEELRRSWKKSSNNLFRSIRKAEAAGVTVREGTGQADLRLFYRLYVASMKRHRSLPRSWTQVKLDQQLLGPSGAFRLFLAEHDGHAVSAAIFHAHGHTVDLLYAGSHSAGREVRADFAMYWHVIRWAVENGYSRFDWGAAREGGTLWRFKSQWSAEPVPEYTYRYGGEPEGPSRADRIRTQHDVIDQNGAPSRREALIAATFDRLPLRAIQAAGTAVYTLF